MSDRIHELVNSIGEKVSRLQGQLSTERSKKEEFLAEIQDLKSALGTKESEIETLKSKIIESKKNIEGGEVQDVVVSNGKNVSDEQIDELVKEIEYCITQLKK